MNGLCLNLSKTSYMIFVNTNRTLPTNFEIKLNSIKLNRVNSVRYLGIVLDYKLRWDDQVSYIRNRLKYLVYVFARFKNIMHFSNLQYSKLWNNYMGRSLQNIFK